MQQTRSGASKGAISGGGGGGDGSASANTLEEEEDEFFALAMLQMAPLLLRLASSQRVGANSTPLAPTVW